MSELTKDFEKYFSLPLKYDDVHGRITDNNGIPILIPDYMGMSIEQSENDELMIDYVVRCANLMPEAIEIIKLACFSPCRDLCKYAKNGAPSIDVPECDYCPEGAFYERAKDFLAKLEGGETA